MKSAERITQLFLLFLFIGYSFFFKLGEPAYRIWDEARLVTNAYEMSTAGNYVVTTVGNNPDMWNTKPPMMIWCQVLCIDFLGLSEFSVRLPAALSAAFTVILVFAFVLYVTKNGWAALVAGIALCTARGLLGKHAVRYGEYDAMLMFFSTCYLLCFFLYTEHNSESRKNKYLLFFFLSLSLAALTKGVAAMLFAPPLLLFLIIRKQFIATLCNKYFYLGAIGFLAIVLGYYFLREHYNPGYLKAVYENELGGRLFTALEHHGGPPDYYWLGLKFERFGSWFWLIPTGLLLLFFQPAQHIKRVLWFAFICATLFIAILSSAQTKLYWYDLPVYPLLAIIIGITVLRLGGIISGMLGGINKNIGLLLVAAVACAQPIYEACGDLSLAADDLNTDSFYDISYYLRNPKFRHADINNTTYICKDYDLQWMIYINQLKDDGFSIKREYFNSDLSFLPGQRVLVHQYDTRNLVESFYNFKVVDKFYGVRLYEITGKKNQ
jgi:4-amino-4-deoxy-L-arabinose transferase-like glycosyltransferase